MTLGRELLAAAGPAGSRSKHYQQAPNGNRRIPRQQISKWTLKGIGGMYNLASHPNKGECRGNARGREREEPRAVRCSWTASPPQLGADCWAGGPLLWPRRAALRFSLRDSVPLPAWSEGYMNRLLCLFRLLEGS